MKKQSFVLDSKTKRLHAMRLIDISQLEKKLYQFEIKPYKKDRTAAQNRLQHFWNNELDRQKTDPQKSLEVIKAFSLNDIRAFNKLTFGVSIMQEDPDFDEVWRVSTGHLSYEYKLKVALIMPVTSLMNVEQGARFLTAYQNHWESLGAELRTSDDFYYEAMGLRR